MARRYCGKHLTVDVAWHDEGYWSARVVGWTARGRDSEPVAVFTRHLRLLEGQANAYDYAWEGSKPARRLRPHFRPRTVREGHAYDSPTTYDAVANHALYFSDLHARFTESCETNVGVIRTTRAVGVEPGSRRPPRRRQRPLL